MSFGGKSSAPQDPILVQFFLGGASSGSAAVLTHPLDLIKVRKQLLKGDGKVSMFQVAADVVKNQGPTGLYKGLSASLLRQFTYSSARIGSYPPIKQVIQGQDEFLSLPKKIAAGMAAGAVGAIVGNPGDLINIRMQGDASLPAEKRRNYRGVVDGLMRVTREEGVLTLWKGSGPNVLRAMFMTTGQLASYDQIKQMLLNNTNGLFKDNLTTHFTAGALAGFIATVICSPVDVVKTKIQFDKGSSGQRQYTGMLDCFVKTFQNDGARGFFKGFVPSFSRLVPQTIFTFIFYEQYAKLIHKYMYGKKQA